MWRCRGLNKSKEQSKMVCTGSGYFLPWSWGEFVFNLSYCNHLVMKMFKFNWWISLAVLFAIAVHSQLKFSPFDSGWCHHYHSNKRTCKTDWWSLKNIYKGSHPAKVRLCLLEIYCVVEKFNPSGTHLTAFLFHHHFICPPSHGH